MIDFLEYVVTELKSKRLSKVHAVDLVRQFSERGPREMSASILHPLLHSNSSDLDELRFSTHFSGGEFFLLDHKVRMKDDLRSVLPAVTYLEMARAAVMQVLPADTRRTLLELQNTVWAKPVIAGEDGVHLHIALIPAGDGRIDYEIYGDAETVHCQGTALTGEPGALQSLVLSDLRETMTRGRLDAATLYERCSALGLEYGASFRSVASITLGEGELLAELHLPEAAKLARDGYDFHPSLLDGALQSALGLIELRTLQLPFALERLRLHARCAETMWAWVRFTERASGIVELDVDLCDADGKVCVQMRGFSTRALYKSGVSAQAPVVPVETHNSAPQFAGVVQTYLCRLFSEVLQLPAGKIEPRVRLEVYGIDSILAMKLTQRLEEGFGPLPKTLFFEYQTIRELAGYFVEQHASSLQRLLMTGAHPRPLPVSSSMETSTPLVHRRSRRRQPAPAMTNEPIAIIGLSGRYPEAEDIAAYWRNLRDGKDCIVEVPKARWDWQAYYSADRNERGRHYSKWGGFISGVDEFDPLFFNMSPSEAEMLDPQERLFLQHAWMALEDAGYTRESLQRVDAQDLPGQVGVYAGVMYSEYQLFGAEATARGTPLGIGVSPASIANRVSYVLNIHGPSLTVDTMCSSSLTAIHLASEDLKSGRTQLALAGGVNVSVHPNKYLVLSAGQFISSEGHCQSFGEGGDGYIPGEGVGVVVLKRLSDAERDGDQIYGVIRGSALNHGGRTNGYTVPNVQAQASVIARALREAGIDARRVGYVEAHGTGTKLGDPIEIAALTKAFEASTKEKGYCLLGSAKSNIGHCESAAGIAGLTKVLLQLKHRQIVPSLHSAQLNPHIDFAQTPFEVNQSLREWPEPEVEGRKYARMAGISSFGAGGSNAHLLVEEYEGSGRVVRHERVVVVLSARTPEQLKHKAEDLLKYVRDEAEGLDLTALGYTLQVGREAMEERVALVVGSAEQLQAMLGGWVEGQTLAGTWRGQVRQDRQALELLGSEGQREQLMGRWQEAGELEKLAEAWCKGAEVRWEASYATGQPRRISLPTYPFARERYWVELPPAKAATAVLHPLLHSNTSDLTEQRYSTHFSGEEFFLTDHRVRLGGGLRKVLPGVAYLEMACAAMLQAQPEETAQTVVELRDVVLAQPLIVGSEGADVHIALMPMGPGGIDYEIYSGEDETVHCQGSAVMGERSAPPSLSLSDLRSEMTRGRLESAALYMRCAALGLEYGPSLQGVSGMLLGDGELLAELHMPATTSLDVAKYELPPALLDSALQAAVGLMDADDDTLYLPYALEHLRIYASCTGKMWAWIRRAKGSEQKEKLDIDLCDEQGKVCVQMQGLCTRAVSKPGTTPQHSQSETLLATPAWEAFSIVQKTLVGGAQRHVLVCGLPKIDAEELASLSPAIKCKCVALPGSDGSLPERYEVGALACLNLLQTLLRSRQSAPEIVQLVVPDSGESSTFAGIAGLLKTAALENPRLRVQVVRVPLETTATALALVLDEEAGQPETMVWRAIEERRVLRWRETMTPVAPRALRDDGVYLITGGMGGLGLVFARAILAAAERAKVVLCGRSVLSESMRAQLVSLERAEYRVVDLSDQAQVDALLAAVRAASGRIDGIVHSAGVLEDSFLLKKDDDTFLKVLRPKVRGACHLDAATAQDDMDFFVLFGSVAGVFGNLGQGDYAAANGFLDSFATYRNELVARGERRGHTLSIDWPLWAEGGMSVDASTLSWLSSQGMQPLDTSAGLAAFHTSLALVDSQALVVAGDPVRIRAMLSPNAEQARKRQREDATRISGDLSELLGRTQDYLRRTFSGILKLPPSKIDAQAELETYGIDSVLAMKLTRALEQQFGALSKTLLFEYQSISALAGYLVNTFGTILEAMFGSEAPASLEAKISRVSRSRRGKRFAAPGAPRVFDIAIVGVAGRYPQAENLATFWHNLREGKDCISEIPSDRWDLHEYYDPDPAKPGKSYSKWGGFVADIDKFDPLFFNISPREASLIDPQERLFMETVWETIEDAGYSRESIRSRAVGVYVGVMWGQYELYGADSVARGETAIPLSSHASIANRISYFYDFRGPSLAVDTMCSSSLTALHLACEALLKGDIEAAIAGGVNLTVHPNKYLGLSQGKFVSSDGRCRSFGSGGDGYVPGEGVGAVLLKPLQTALRDGDQVYAVIRSTAINHGGKTNGYSVPNPHAQADVIVEACRKAGIEPSSLGYIEAHGTGTALGDPIEISGLSKAFADTTNAKQICPIGSVKSIIGHLEAAAGIAALSKVLLQIKHAQLSPSLHASPPNPNIDFEQTPFYVQTALTEWKRLATHPRRAGISSFGAGGANAHVILEEYPRSRSGTPPIATPEAFLLSARDVSALRRYAERYIAYLENANDISLQDLAYTSQVGRTQMPARLAVIASDMVDLREKLCRWVALQNTDESISTGLPSDLEDVYDGGVGQPHRVDRLIDGRAGKAFLADLLANRDLSKLLGLWVIGVDVDWTLMHRNGEPQRVSMPTYPFAKERYWVERRIEKFPSSLPMAPAAAEADDSQRLYFHPHWRPAPLVLSDNANTAAHGVIWVLDDTADLALALETLAPQDTGSIVRIQFRKGAAFERIGEDTCAIDPSDDAQWRDLVQVFQREARLPQAIVHCPRGYCDIRDERQLAKRLDQGIYALFHLCKELIALRHQTVKIVSMYAADIATAVDRAVAAFLKSLQAEHPGYFSKTIELSDKPFTAAECATLLLGELRAPTGQAEELLYRHAINEPTRLARAWIRKELTRAYSSLPLKRGGVYLISGGLGGLGFVFAEYFAVQYQAKLVLAGRSAPSATQRAALAKLETYGAEVLYVQADVSRREDSLRLSLAAQKRFAEIDGVIHAAGANRDGFLLKKTRGDIDSVLAAKLGGAIHLDVATRDHALQFFVLFGSVAGALGNAGQADYAYANQFLDAFADDRETLRRAGQRSGRTLSIDWPYWSQGGMRLSPEDVLMRERQTGLAPLPTEEGLRCWEECLSADAAQVMVLYGRASRLVESVASKSAPQKTKAASTADATIIYEMTVAYLQRQVGDEIKLAPERVGRSDRFDSLGIDSVMINRLNAALESDLGALPRTLFYEYETPTELAQYLLKHAREPLEALFGVVGDVEEATLQPPLTAAAMFAAARDEDLRKEGLRAEEDKIAIVGVHGRYPHVEELDGLWESLRDGKDLVGEVPSERWDAHAFYDVDPAASVDGKIYCKWGGFVRDHDKFDAAFFNIPADEAKVIDPQERLMLESAWAALEDAGYTRQSLKQLFPKGRGAGVGVFVGVTTQSYQLVAFEQEARGGQHLRANAMPWSIANRISYFFDFNGPSMPVDTACSSSLVALHLACESLKRQECQVALAGGVNLYLHPAKYKSLCDRRMLSADGKCHSYGAGDDGFVPGEAVGTLVLKPLRRAVADKDHIYAVVCGSAFDHSGRSNGYSAPNPNAQADLIVAALKNADVHPESISYVEGHGTGTLLGDSLEVAALAQAFNRMTEKQQFCAIGCIKANMGHSESAAGIAGLTKVLLQMQHRKLLPSIHAAQINPQIDFAQTPFVLQQTLSDWTPPSQYPRRALVNAFGAGGVNACVIVEEHVGDQPAVPSRAPGRCVFVLSALNEGRLAAYANLMLTWLKTHGSVDIAALCYTSQVGREAMRERLAFVVGDVAGLIVQLEDRCRSDAGAREPHHADDSKKQTSEIVGERGLSDLDDLARRWCEGERIDWETLHVNEKPSRISLPTYPFKRERHWVTDGSLAQGKVHAGENLHPLISSNTSTLRESSFRSLLQTDAFYAIDHHVGSEAIFPGAGFLEMACIAGILAGERRVTGICDIVWATPLSFRHGTQHVRTHLKQNDGFVEYAVSSIDADEEAIVYCEGRLAFDVREQAKTTSPARGIVGDLAARGTHETGTAFYERFRQRGFDYGPAFRTVEDVWVGETSALSRLRLPDHLKRDFAEFVLHPSMIDGALQTIACMAGGMSDTDEAAAPYVPFALDELEIHRALPQVCYAHVTCVDAVATGWRQGVRKFRITLLNENEEIVVVLRNLYVRALTERRSERGQEISA